MCVYVSICVYVCVHGYINACVYVYMCMYAHAVWSHLDPPFMIHEHILSVARQITSRLLIAPVSLAIALREREMIKSGLHLLLGAVHIQWLINVGVKKLGLFALVQNNSKGPSQLQSSLWYQLEPLLLLHCFPHPLPLSSCSGEHVPGNFLNTNLHFRVCFPGNPDSHYGFII